MKRDMDLVRELLFSIERRSSNGQLKRLLDGTGPDERLSHHLQLLVEAGYAKTVAKTQQGGIRLQLTWEGHEFAALSRSDEMWDRAKEFVVEKTGDMSLVALKATLAKWALDIVAAGERWKLKSEENPAVELPQIPERIAAPLPPSEPRWSYVQPYQTVSFVASTARYDGRFWNGEAEGLPIYLL